jgi:hypothetical protein
MADKIIELRFTRKIPMLFTSAAALVLSASAIVSPLTNLLHLHPKPATQDARVQISIRNEAIALREVKVGRQVYAILPNRVLTLRATPGTIVYYASTMGGHKPGDVFVAIDANVKGQALPIK